MSSLLGLLNKFKKALAEGKRVFRWGDPGYGLEYNTLKETHKVSRRLWNADIARNPRVVGSGPNDEFLRKDVMKKKNRAHGKSGYVHYKQEKVNGRGSS